MKISRPLSAALVATLSLLTACPDDSCVAAGTDVATPCGTKRIEELRVGDAILCVDVATGRVLPTTIVAVRVSERPCVELVAADGSTLRCTDDHPIYSPERGDYVAARAWVDGSCRALLVVGPDGGARELAVREVRANVGVHAVFDLTVATAHHNFIAGGVVVHNKSTEGHYAETDSADTSAGAETEGAPSCNDFDPPAAPTVDAPSESEWSLAGLANFGLTVAGAEHDDSGALVVAGSVDKRLELDDTVLVNADDPALRGYIASIDSDGVLTWSASLHAAQGAAVITALAVSETGHVFVAGITQAPLRVDGCAPDGFESEDGAFVAAFDREGRPLWSRRLGYLEPRRVALAIVDGRVHALLSRDSGEVDRYVLMTASGANFRTELEVLRSASAPGPVFADAVAGAFGRVAVSGRFIGGLRAREELVSDADEGAFVVVLTDTSIEWQSIASGEGISRAFVSAVGEGDQQGYYFATQHGGSLTVGDETLSSAGESVALLRLDSGGAIVWRERLTADGGVELGDLDAADEGVLVGGTYRGSLELAGEPHAGAGDDDAFFGLLDGDGGVGRSHGFAIIDSQRVLAASRDRAGNIALAGSYRGDADFGHGALGAHGIGLFITKQTHE